MELTDGEKLIAVMLSDLMEAQGINREVDPAFVKRAIFNGDLWALKWQYHGLFHSEDTPEEVASEVAAIMGMCGFLEYSLSQLDSSERSKVSHTGEKVFRGFDGNNETDHYGVSETFVRDMNRFDEFRGREMNSHMPMLDKYRRMLSVYDATSTASALNADQLEAVLTA